MRLLTRRYDRPFGGKISSKLEALQRNPCKLSDLGSVSNEGSLNPQNIGECGVCTCVNAVSRTPMVSVKGP